MKKIIASVLLLMINVFAFAQKEQNGDKTDSVDKITVSVETSPEFPGGKLALTKYLSANIRYPESARQNNIEGKAVVRFVVCKDGSLCEGTIVKSVDSSIDKEVLRVVTAMPKWKPGTQNGEAVRVFYTLPVTFNLHNQKDTVVYTSVEKEATFLLGKEILEGTIKQNLKYPYEALKKKKSGEVLVQVVIDEDGLITKSSILNGLGYGCDEEALRIIRLMPQLWTPAMNKGKAVKSYYNIPVKFTLPE